MRPAFRELTTGRIPDMLRAYLLAVLIEMVAVNSLAAMALEQRLWKRQPRMAK